MDIQQITRETLDKAAAALVASGDIRKALAVSDGLVGYNLQEAAKQLVYLDSPFRRSIPRIVKPGANSDHWRTITALSSPLLFTQESAAATGFAYTFGGSAEDGSSGAKTLTAAFKVAGILGQVTLEAVRSAQGWDDALAKESTNALLLAQKLEGQAFLGSTLTALPSSYGNPAQVAAPVVALSTTVGSITATTTTYYCQVLPLNIMAANRATLDTTSLAPMTLNSTTQENLMDGKAKTIAMIAPLGATAAGHGMDRLSAEGNSGSISPASQCLRISWTPLKGAAAYAVFVGTTTGSANLKCEAIVTQAQVTLKSLVGTGAAATALTFTTDRTADAKAYDGIIPQIFVTTSGAYIKNVGSALTGAAADGEVVELQDAFASIFDNAKIGKLRVICSGHDARSIAKRGITSNAMQIFAQTNAAGRTSMTIGTHVGEIINATTGDVCPIDVEPWLPQGQIMILPTEIPYPMANASAPFQWVGNYDWMRFDYYPTTSTGPVYPFEVRCNGALEAIFTGGCGLLYNIYKT